METVDNSRRRFLVASTTVVGAAGAAMATVPFIASLNPSERAKAAGAPVRVDLTKIEPGQQITIPWRQKPVWILKRTPEILARMDRPKHLARLTDPDSGVASQQPEYTQNAYRSQRDDVFVVIAICTHLGCVPSFRPDIAPDDLGPDWPGGYFCPCHGSKFDFAGRVYKGVPAPTNLVVPPYRFLSDTSLEVGTDPDQATG